MSDLRIDMEYSTLYGEEPVNPAVDNAAAFIAIHDGPSGDATGIRLGPDEARRLRDWLSGRLS